MSLWISTCISGISYGMMLFLLAAGLTLTLGLLKIVNLTHGSFYLLASYIAITIVVTSGSWILAVIVGAICMAFLGVALQAGLFQRYAKGDLAQVLLTFGCYLFLAGFMLSIWGGLPQYVPIPAYITGTINIGNISISIYKLMLICLGIVVGLMLLWLQERTKWGAIIRAGVDDEQMVEAVGINITLVKCFVFGLGTLLAGLAGAVMVSFTGAYPGLDITILLLSLIIVVIGGAGSLKGALIAALLIGLVQNFSVVFLPKFSLAIVYVPMAIILVIKQEGLFGRK